MNGMETSAEIVRLYAKESIVAAMTAYSWNDISEEANSVGVFDSVDKPLFAAAIIDDLTRIARRSGMAIFKEKNRARLEGRRILPAEDVELFGKSTAGIYSAILMDVRMPKSIRSMSIAEILSPLRWQGLPPVCSPLSKPPA